MESLTLTEFCDKIPKQRAILIVVEKDLTEGIYDIEKININLQELLKGNFGCYFDLDKEICYAWSHNPENDSYSLRKIENKLTLYLHDKVKRSLGITNYIKIKK